MAFKREWDHLGGQVSGDQAAQRLKAVILRAAARAELAAPVSAKGSFVAKGDSFDAFQAIAKVLSPATKDVLIVDPYLDEHALFDFLPLAPGGVSVRLLGDAANAKLMQSLRAGAIRWQAQHGASRPLEVRQATARSLHDRLILIDGKAVWSLSQSLKDFAARSHASILLVDDEIARLKIPSYEALWQAAAPL